MPELAPQFTKRTYQWTAWKTVQALKAGVYQYENDGTTYTIWFYDGPEVHIANIWLGTVPDGVIGGGYSQSQNDTDKTNFETYWLEGANRAIATPVPVMKDGYASSSGNTFTAIMATAYTEQTSAAQRSIVSSSANDTSAGTGARTVKITYYDGSMNGPYYETLSLNGTGAVNTVATNIRFIERMEVTTVGSLLGNEGTISLKTTTAGGGSTFASIAAGDNETNWCHHYVGAGKVAKLVIVTGSIKGMSSGAITARRSTPTVANTPEITISPQLKIAPGAENEVQYPVPVEVIGPARVALWARSDASSGTLEWTAGLGLYEV